jgi:hypothetical protein
MSFKYIFEIHGNVLFITKKDSKQENLKKCGETKEAREKGNNGHCTFSHKLLKVKLKMHKRVRFKRSTNHK